MKVVSRNYGSRRSHPQPFIDFEALQLNEASRKKFEKAKEVVQNFHYTKRGTCPVISGGVGLPSSVTEEPNFSVKASTRGVFDSRKERVSGFGSKQEWKILTLHQIKGIREPKIVDQRQQDSRLKSNRKIFVSISKSNRQQMSKQKRGNVQPKLAEIGGNYEMLRSLSNRRHIVEKIELQMQEKVHTGESRLICG